MLWVLRQRSTVPQPMMHLMCCFVCLESSPWVWKPQDPVLRPLWLKREELVTQCQALPRQTWTICNEMVRPRRCVLEDFPRSSPVKQCRAVA
jgi:hypothetical protein